MQEDKTVADPGDCRDQLQLIFYDQQDRQIDDLHVVETGIFISPTESVDLVLSTCPRLDSDLMKAISHADLLEGAFHLEVSYGITGDYLFWIFGFRIY